MPEYDQLEEALLTYGLRPRGGFVMSAEDCTAGQPGGVGETLVMIGNAGPTMWPAFSRQRQEGANPLDEWTKRILSPIAQSVGATAVYPWSQPYRPFQQWAMRSEPVSASPLGILIHPQHGLWHAYRAAFIFPNEIELPARTVEPSPCESCSEKPCLSACPVDAFANEGFDVQACAGHISQSSDKQICRCSGCRARAACPVGAPYDDEQVRFHMSAFYASRAPT